MITLQNISVCYGQNTVYKDFSFHFGRGVNVVLGPSGCGKTTLLNVIAGLVPYSGSCQKQGEVAIVLQQPCLAPVSVRKNICLVAQNRERIAKVLEVTRLAEKADCNVGALSGGEQQRVSLARAFATDREILLLDEPFSNLDYGVKQQLQQVLDQLLQTYCKTVLLVTHDIQDALAMADRIYLLADKPCTLTQVAEISTPRAVRDQYDSQMLQYKKQLEQLLKQTGGYQ